jgi:hypothetical protein
LAKADITEKIDVPTEGSLDSIATLIIANNLNALFSAGNEFIRPERGAKFTNCPLNSPLQQAWGAKIRAFIHTLNIFFIPLCPVKSDQ